MNFSMVKFRLSMLISLALIIGATTLILLIVLTLMGVESILLLGLLVVGINVLEWLFAPKLIDRMYKTRELGPGDPVEIKEIVAKIASKANISQPKLVIAETDLPNAFAYGSPLTGNKVAVTKGLISILNYDEIEAVLGHELGHLKHRDVQMMMIVSMLPAVLYFISFSLFFSSMSSSRQNNGLIALIGILSFIGYIIINLLVLGYNRMRESYADRHSVSVVDNGARKLSSALAKIYTYSARMGNRNRAKKGPNVNSSFRGLFIIDPSSVNVEDLKALNGEELIQSIVNRKLSLTDRLMEIMSTHPNIIKRIRTLERYK
ncbi:MAG: M48 family metalloprotease [Nitrososphaerota archaeon]|nr:M48 family metalloprotease [Nitrososphaerota archaeon]